MALLYPILGFLGLILIIILIVAWFKERDAIKSENKKRDQMSDLTRKKLDDDEDFGKKDREKLNKLAEASIIENDKIKEAVEEEVEEELEEEKDN